MSSRIVLIVVLVLVLDNANAQIKGIDEGDQVKITSIYGQEITGKVISILPSELCLMKEDSSRVDVSMYDIDELKVRTRISKTVRGVLKGGAIGGFSMGFITMATFSGGDFLSSSQSSSEWFLEGARAGIVFGCVIGLVVGAAQKDQWWKKKKVEFTVEPIALDYTHLAAHGITAGFCVNL